MTNRSDPQPTVHVAVPVQDEVDQLPRCIDSLRRQAGVPVVAWFCVNQPESWHDDPDQRSRCEANRTCLEILSGVTDLDLRVLDRTTPGHGWRPKRGGVGRARRELMDSITAVASPSDLIVSLDADTTMDAGYLLSVADAFAAHPEACALASRYCHPRIDDDRISRAMLGYEIYMRFYVLNMWRIGSPYSFTALGSAMAFPVSIYRKIGGITPRTSGEDFYLLQKLVKVGRVLHWSEARVSPGTRESIRVPVGTGQAILAACEGRHADRYPLYPMERFDDVGRTTSAFASLFEGPAETPLDAFLHEQLKTEALWQGLRDNHPTRAGFVRACHERVDGLRILQYLKAEYRRAPTEDSVTLSRWLTRHGRALPGTEEDAVAWADALREHPLSTLATDDLDSIRQMLCRMEDHYRQTDFLHG